MREAFKKALVVSPQSQTGRAIEDSIIRGEWNKSEIEKGKKLRELGDKLFELGAGWYGLKIDPVGFGGLKKGEGIAEMRRIWDRLKSQVLVQRRGERMELLARLSDGMWLSEEHQSVGHFLMANRTFSQEEQLTSAARLFIAGISDLSNCSELETRELIVFVSGRVKGQVVGLPLTYNAVAEWMVLKSANRTEAAV